MCEPTLILSVAVGAAKAGAEIAEQNRVHAYQKAQVQRKNAIAKQDYLNKIQISAVTDQQKLRARQAELEGAAAEQDAYYKQLEINQMEADRASEVAQRELNEKIAEAQFTGQTKLAEAIRAQGTVLAGDTAGQSMLLEAQQAERELGFATAEIDAGLWNAENQFNAKQFEIGMGKFAADTRATKGIKGASSFAPMASFQTIRPMKQADPKKPSQLGPILSGITTGIGVYSGTAYEGRELFGKDTGG